MRLIFEPRAYLLSYQVIDDRQLESFLLDHRLQGWETDTDVGGDKLVETSGRVCYMSFVKPRPGGNKAYIDHIKKVGHGSVLEHAVYSVLFTDVSRSLTHELVRHRAGVGYSQLSQRYVDESVAEFVVPPDLQDEVKAALAYRDQTYIGLEKSENVDILRDELLSRVANKQGPENAEQIMAGLRWIRNVLRSNEDYREFSDYLFRKMSPPLESQPMTEPGAPTMGPSQVDKTTIRKAARGAARSVLPNATETKIVVTANARAWRHMIEMRGAAPAETEIRRAFHKAWKLLNDKSPTLFGDYNWAYDPDTKEPLDVSTPYRKV